MKKVLVFILMIVAFVACSKDDDSGNSIKKATVKGAQLIYENSAGTRAGTRATTEEVQSFMTVDEQGNVNPIRFITESGDTINMWIRDIKNFNDEYLVLEGDFTFNGIYLRQLLVNKNTELLYAMPPNIWCNIECPAFEDKNNNIYWGSFNHMVYRFNISNPDNITVENYLPDDQDIYKYWVNKDGICYYFISPKMYNFKCPGGRIYNHRELLNDEYDNYSVFCGTNGKFYIACSSHEKDLSKVFEVKVIDDNTIQAIEVVSHPEYIYVGSDFCPNFSANSCVLSNGDNIIVFEETTNELRKLDVNMPNTCYVGWGIDYPNFFVSSESLWAVDLSESMIYQLKLKDYTLNVIDLVKEGYEMNAGTITCSINGPGLSFSGIRYADGQNIVGTINEDGTITAFEKTKTSNKITTLLRLN